MRTSRSSPCSACSCCCRTCTASRREIHVEAERLYREFAPAENLDFELRHKAIVDRFGRYPHRNEVLGRSSTPEEIEFLRQPGSSF